MASQRSLARDLLFERTDDPVLVVDGSGRILERNGAARELLAAAEAADAGPADHVARYPALAPIARGPIRDDAGPEVTVGSRTFRGRALALPAEDGTPPGRAIVLRDVTRERRAESSLERLATVDATTGVPNRAQFLELARHAEGLARRSGRPLGWLVVDVDDFGAVNRRHGHATGDLVLRSVAAVAASSVRVGDVLGRIGGDAFGACLPDTGPKGAATVARRLRALVANLHVAVPDGEVRVTVSVGIHASHGAEADLEAGLALAAEGRARAVRAGGDGVAFGDPELEPGGGAPPTD